jgi:thioredoxin:protein disulfide reductase
VLGVVYAAGAGNARMAVQAAEAELPWLVNREAEALALARAQGKPLIIDFWGDWCAACKELDHTAWSDPQVREAARGFVLLKIDNSADKMADPRTSDLVDQAMEKYGVISQPTVVFIDPQGRELPAEARVTAVVDGREMLRRLRSVAGACAAAACLARW